MQTLPRTLLALSLAHLLADFVLQTRRLVEGKMRGQALAYFLHGLIHYLSAICVIGFFLPGTVLVWRTHLVVAGLAFVHLLIDLAKMRLGASRHTGRGPTAYIVDQLAHLLTIALAAWLLLPGISFHDFAVSIQSLRTLRNRLLAVPVIYLAVIFAGGYLIRSLTRSMAESMKAGELPESREQLQNAGLYIGWLERFLILTALLLKSPAAVGLILTAKTIARYPEFKSARFAEYVLIGTLLSVLLALLGAVLLSWLLSGDVHLSG
jgi:Protein of unknown function (DUF3307)